MVTKKEMVEDIKYLKKALNGEYAVNEDWLVNTAYPKLSDGSMSINEFLLENIKDIFSEAKYNNYDYITKESMEKFNSDKKVKLIAKKYKIESCLYC